MNHFAKMCHSKKVDEITYSDDEEIYTIPFVICSIEENSRRITKLNINGKSMMCVIDTGAENVMSEKSCQMRILKPNRQWKKKLYGYGKTKLPIVGEITVQVNSHVMNTAEELHFQVIQ